MTALRLPYVGSKATIMHLILPYFPKHTTHIQPFFGGGNAFFAICAAGMKAKHNILNDIDSNATTFFWVCQHHEAELLRIWDYSPIADDIFNAAKVRYKVPLSESSTDAERIQRAADWLYLRAFSLYSKGSTLRCLVHQSATQNNAREKIQAIANELRDCTILNRTAIQALSALGVSTNDDYAKCFAYCDPPYINSGVKYAAAWNASDLHELIAALETKAAYGMRYAISEYDSPLIREIAAQYRLRVHEITTTRSMGKAANVDILLTNYDPQHKLF